MTSATPTAAPRCGGIVVFGSSTFYNNISVRNNKITGTVNGYGISLYQTNNNIVVSDNEVDSYNTASLNADPSCSAAGLQIVRAVRYLDAGATASRPTAATAGRSGGGATIIPGTPFYDTTLGKPIWNTGAGWKDATGATV